MAKKISNSLVTLSSAAILAIYAAGYERTLPAAERFAEIAQRRAPVPVESRIAPVEKPALFATKNAQPQPSEKTALYKEAVTSAAAATPAIDIAPSSVSVPAPVSVPAAEAPADAPAAPAAPAAAPTMTATPAAQYKDGVYLGWGYSRHGNIQAFVRIENGRIIHAGIEKCQMRWSCDLIAHLPPQVVQRQSAEVDFVTGATQSGDSFYGAIANALALAK